MDQHSKNRNESTQNYKASKITLIIIGCAVFILSYLFFSLEIVQNNPFIRNEILAYSIYNLVVILTIEKRKI